MHNRGHNNISNTSGSDKVSISFKEFTNTMVEDDVTASEAQKRYEKYLQRFSKSDDVLKDEQWFQEHANMDREGAIPRDGKARVPKYIGTMYRDGLVP